MGRTSKWIKNLLSKKKVKDKEKEKEKDSSPISAHQNPSSPISVAPATPKEKRRWSFRRSSATATANSVDVTSTTLPFPENYEQKKHTRQEIIDFPAASPADKCKEIAGAMLSQPQSTAANHFLIIEEAAATKIQSVFRSYLARKALCALKGLVKLQALVRGHLVRKQAVETLRCMQALVMVQARARAQRTHNTDRTDRPASAHRRPDHTTEENIKIVEMDIGQVPKGSKKSVRNSSPAPSEPMELSPRASSGRFEDFETAQNSPYISRPPSVYSKADYAESLCYDFPLFPSYMANTESSRAKVRSQSAPKQRPVDHERLSLTATKRRPSIEGRNVPRAVRMQRSSSHIGPEGQSYHYPWSVKLDKSTVSVVESECGSTSTVFTNGYYCNSVVGFDVRGSKY